MRSKSKILRFIILVIILLQTGCGIGGHWMTGDPSAGLNVKPYIAYWEKERMTEESRLEDWMACGGLSDGTFGLDRKKQFPDESNDTFRTRLEFEFQRCMISYGYRYTGDCSSKYMQARPLCGAL